MDDGSFESKQSKAEGLNTHSLSYEDVGFICLVLQSKWGLQVKPRSQNYKGSFLYYQI